MDSSAVRRPCFIEGDDGLASLAEMEAGLSETSHHHTQNHPFFSRASYYSAKPKRRSSLRNLSLQSPIDSSPRLGSAWYDARYEGHRPHFLEVCFLCKKPLGDNRDIFMYRGDTPFCSEDCRQEQIDKDEAKEKNSNHSASMKALRSKTESKNHRLPPPSKIRTTLTVLAPLLPLNSAQDGEEIEKIKTCKKTERRNCVYMQARRNV